MVASEQSLPGWLFAATEVGVPAPVDSLLQELPLDRLTWQNFEKMCYRLARDEADVKCCRMHGEPGHPQDGIDLFAKRAGRTKWTVYQCKKVDGFGPAAITNAGREVLRGRFLSRAEAFVLCTSESLRAPIRWEAVEELEADLRRHGVELEVWDALELNARLKAKPNLVADFFHSEWARSFCESVPANLAGRLAPDDVRKFRRACRGFYEQCFGQADAGWLASGRGGRPLPPLAQRFVLRDVIERRAPLPRMEEDSRRAEHEETGAGHMEWKADRRERPRRRPRQQSAPEIRLGVSEWLARDGQFVLAGEPGAGKSTILRFLALDLLSDAPTLAPVAQAWGDHLPVWVPFALWTRRIAEREGASVSLVELLREWFTSYSNSHLWPLVERALADERLLLLVDGLDEWRDESAARVALQLLQVFVGQRNTPAVLVGRPQGLAALSPFPQGYREATLAPLDQPQQRVFAERLLRVAEGTEARIDDFFRDLENVPALRAIAGVPLMLGLLLRQHLEHARLPISRFRVGERMVETLLRDHPIRRQQAALLRAESILDKRELRDALAYVAWRTHTERPEGLVESDVLREWLAFFFSDDDCGLGYPRAEARKLSVELLRHGEREIGVLVERAPGWSGFFHRTIQELLAAEHIGTLDRPAQLAVLRERASQPHWREVLLAWCHRRSAPDFSEIVAVLEELETTLDVSVRHRVSELLAELATGDFSLPVNLARRLTRRLVETIWVCEWPRHRGRLLELALDGLHGVHAVRSIVQEAVRAWFPARSGASYRLAAETAKWAPSPALIEALLRTLHHEEESAQRAAAEALGVFAAGDDAVADQLAHLASTSIRATTRACALEALGRARIDDPRLAGLCERDRRSGSGEVALAAIAIRVRKGFQTEDDLRRLLRLAARGPFHVDYYWRPDLVDALLNGWPRSSKIKKAVIASLQLDRPWDDEVMEHEVAFPVLIRGFSGDEKAALALAGFFRRDSAFISSGLEFREWLPGHARWFATHPAVSAAVEVRLFRDMHESEHRFALLALLARTPRVKAHLLEALGRAKSFGHWPAWALLEGWGIEDAEVGEALRQSLDAQPGLIASVGDMISKIFPVSDEARRRLLKCFETEEVQWPWLLLSALVAVDGHLSRPEVLESCLRLLARAPAWQQEHVRNALITHASLDPRVRALAMAELDRRDGALSAVAEGFGHDAEIRSRLIDVLAPLPAEARTLIVDRLAALPLGDPFAREMLAQFDRDRDGDVKARAAVAYARREQANGPLDLALVSRLRTMLHAVGPDNEERRQAALAVILDFREFNVFREEFSGRFAEGHSLFSHDLRSRKEILLRQLARRWTSLKSALNSEEFAQFTYSEGQLWFAHRLAPLVEEDDEAREFLESRISYAEQDGIAIGLLDFLVQTEPGSERLLALCVGVFHGRVKTPLYGWADQMQTAALFAEHWMGDKQAREQLTAGFAPAQLPEPVVVALTLGWPDSEELVRYDAAAAAERRSVSWNVWHALGATFWAPIRLAQVVRRFAARRGGGDHYVFREAMPYYVARARRDEQARQELLSVLRKAQSPDVRVTVARLLAHAVPGWSDLRHWLKVEAADAKSQFGFNLATSQVENLAAPLIDG